MKIKRLYLFLIIALILNTGNSFSQGWTSRPDYNVAAGGDGSAAFSIGDTIYISGGLNSKSFRKYNTITNQWNNTGLIPGVINSRAFGIGFSINGKGYIGLGIDGTTSKNDLWEYDPSTNGWTQRSNYPGAARDGLFIFVTDDLVFAGGGEDPFTLVQSNKCYFYNPVQNSWTPIADFPLTGIIYPFAFTIGNKGYVSCGQQATEIVSTFEFSEILDMWLPRADFIGAARQAGVSFVLNDIAYCGLGMDQNNFYNDFYTYDAVSDSWSTSIPLPGTARSFGVAATSGSKAYAGLGWSFTSTSNYYKDWWEFSLIPSSVNNITGDNTSINIFPNPATSNISININEFKNPDYKIINELGKIVAEGTIIKNGMINISLLDQGIYNLLITEKEKISRGTFIRN